MKREHQETALRLLQELHDKSLVLNAFIKARQDDASGEGAGGASPHLLHELARHAGNLENESLFGLELLHPKDGKAHG
jgi:hypothetical protein